MSSLGPGEAAGSAGSISYGEDRPIQVRLMAPNAQGQSAGDTAFHAEVLGRILARKRLARRKQAERFSKWTEVDESLRMFVDLSRKAVRGDGTKSSDKVEMPFERAIMIPASYAIHQVRLTQMLGLYLHRDPPLQVTGRGSEDIAGAPSVEAVLAYDTDQSRYPSVMHSFIQDADRYGVGVVYDTWETEEGWVYPSRQNPLFQVLRRFGLMPSKSWDVAREFNRWMNVDPYQFYPDPRIPISLLQEGEFIGHGFRRGSSWLRSKAPADGQPGPYFNIEQAIKMTSAIGAAARTTDAHQDQPSAGSVDGFGDFGLAGSPDEKDRGYHRLDHLQIRLVPSEWKLSAKDRPEIWWFTVANDNTIIRAHPCPYDHNQFTYAAAEVNPDPHTVHNPGMIELLLPSQRLVNWLYNSHIENARKILNDSLIVAPSLVEMSDLTNPQAARHIRLTQKGEELVTAGRDARTFMPQLEVSDFTRQHIETASQVIDFMQRMAASNDPAQGAPTKEDKTLGEVQSIIAASSARLAITVQLIDSQAMRSLCARAIANRQQLTSKEQWYRIVGDLGDVAANQAIQRVQLDRYDLQGNYDFIAHSSVLPADPVRNAQFWLGMLQTGAAYPVLSDPQYSPDGYILDVRKIFNKAAIEGGAKNIQEFYRQWTPSLMQQQQAQQQAAAQQRAQQQGQGVNVQVVPDEQMQRAVQAGNAVPAPMDPRAAALARMMPGVGGIQ